MAPDILLCRGGDVLRRRWCGQDSTNNVRCRPEDQPPSIWLDDPHRRDGYVHSVVVGSHMLIIFAAIISFPPFTGFTTTVTLCGFAYGMKGFFVASAGTLIGSAVAFSVLRWLFSARLRKWVATNEKWQALESVVVSGLLMHILVTTHLFCIRGPRACFS